MELQDEDIALAWEEILSDHKYHLMLLEIQGAYPQKKSLYVSHSDLDLYKGIDMGAFILKNPDRALAIGKRTLKSLMPATWEPDNEINIRITDLPKDAKVDVSLLRAKHLGTLVAVEGMVRKATAPRPRLSRGLYRCDKCDATVWVPQTGMLQKEPLLCPNEGCNKSAPRFTLDEKNSEYIDTQRIEIQENPEGLRGGKQPERLFGYVEDDISGQITPGNRVTLNGILRSVQKTERDKSTIFEIYMDVLSTEFEQSDFSELEITEQDEAKILEMSKDPNLMANIVKSIAPTIFGMDKEKEAVALQLFGGTHKVMDDGTSIRGDIHILMMGDPGVAKSQILRFMSGLSPRGIYASGKSASAAGLCVHGDTILDLEKGQVKISDYVNSHMTQPEEYRPGIWRQAVEGDRIEAPSDLGSLRLLPITYVWRIKTPEKLIRITAGSDSLTLTPETKIQAMHNGRFDWIPSGEVAEGDLVAIVRENMRMMPVDSVEVLTEDLPDYVYDLTVDPAHAFIGSGFTIHNTAAAVKDDFGDGRWTLEAGALVLADKGLACIDELDKMTDQDRSSLHEAMESQKISVAKAGITGTLQCRCSLLAAANPKFGRFDPDENIVKQIDLPPALMSRFDLIFVLRDTPDKKRDKDIASHILESHWRGQALANRDKKTTAGNDVDRAMEATADMKPPYDQNIIRKYVAYAKKNCFPVFTTEAFDIIQDDYLRIRGMGDEGSIPITARQLEGYVRLSEASARMNLRDSVTIEDANVAVDLINYYLNKMAKTDSGFDIDMIGSDTTQKDRKTINIIKKVIEHYTPTGGVTMEVLIQETKLDEAVIQRDINMLKDLTEVIENKGKYRKI